jgi:methylenetetrahydrofolate dehydrogenase (NADP+)/methenyltetrahydrofolate cyclohydrolase
MAVRLDGVAVAEELKAGLRAQVVSLGERGLHPVLALVSAGDDPGVRVYRRQIQRTAQEVGVAIRDVVLPAQAAAAQVVEAVRHLADDPTVHGIVPLRPFPAGVPEPQVLEALDPTKDPDCLHPVNVGRLALGHPAVYPVTPWACFVLLDRYFARDGQDPRRGFEGRDLVIVGRSNVVGKPAYLMALQRNATPTTVHSYTWRAGALAAHTRRADILIVAMGRPEFITAEMVKPGAVIVDVGINVVPVHATPGVPAVDERGRPRYRTVGDVAFEAVAPVAAAITPVPGGVGAVTTVLLLDNVVRRCASV